MVSGMSLEVDHKRGVAWVRGRPVAVEEGRKEFQNKLASLFPGDFLAVSTSLFASRQRVARPAPSQGFFVFRLFTLLNVPYY